MLYTGDAREDNTGEPTPEVQAVKVSLMSHLHMAEADIMDRPWALCLWDCYTHQVQTGGAKFLDPGAIDAAREAAAKLQAKIDAGEVKFDGI